MTTRIDEIRARADAATPGPWGTEYDGKGTYHVHARLRTTPSEGMASDGVVASLHGEHGDTQAYRNARFVAHARQDVMFLLGRVAELEARVAASQSERTAALREAANALAKKAKDLTGEFYNRNSLHEDGPFATVATWKNAADLLRRMADEAQQSEVAA